jgi:hypothetical protein
VNVLLCFDGRVKRMLDLEGECLNVFFSNLYSASGHEANLVHALCMKMKFFSWAYVGLKAEGYENSFGV